MNRSALDCLFGAAFALAMNGALAQPARKPALIGVLSANFPPPREDACYDAFRKGMRDYGYVEGRDVVYEPRWSELGVKRMEPLAADLVARKVDLIMVGTALAAIAAKAATGAIPIVMGPVNDPVELGLVSSLGRPGGNVTGFALFSREYTVKRLEFVRELAGPGAKVSILTNPTQSTIERKYYDSAARVLSLEASLMPVRGPEDLAGAFDTAVRNASKAVVLTGNPLFARERSRIAKLALTHRLPVISGDAGIEITGILAYYGTAPWELCGAAAKHVDRILKGANPADLPVEQATRIESVINLKTAQAIGVRLPQSLLLRADRVIE